MESAYSQSSSVGVFAGAEVHQFAVTKDVLKQFMVYVQAKAISKTAVVQLCGGNDRVADKSFGILATSAKNLRFVQDILKTWASGACISATTISCPRMEFEDKGLDLSTTIQKATFTLKDSGGFSKDLADTWGIEKTWITFDRGRMQISNGCQFSGEDFKECMDGKNGWWYNYPRANDKVEIYNPEKIIGDSYPKSAEMLNQFKLMNNVALYDESVQMSEVVDATSIPAYSAAEAVEAMVKVVAQANDIKKKEREEMILSFTTGILFFIPGAGNAAGAAGLTAVRSMLRLIGAVGEAGILVYDMASNPENAFISVFTYLAGNAVGRNGFKSAASARRGVSSKEYDSLGNVKLRLDKVTSLRGNTRKI